jgi:hypothetical protein
VVRHHDSGCPGRKIDCIGEIRWIAALDNPCSGKTLRMRMLHGPVVHYHHGPAKLASESNKRNDIGSASAYDETYCGSDDLECNLNSIVFPEHPAAAREHRFFLIGSNTLKNA